MYLYHFCTKHSRPKKCKEEKLVTQKPKQNNVNTQFRPQNRPVCEGNISQILRSKKQIMVEYNLRSDRHCFLPTTRSSKEWERNKQSEEYPISFSDDPYIAPAEWVRQ